MKMKLAERCAYKNNASNVKMDDKIIRKKSTLFTEQYTRSWEANALDHFSVYCLFTDGDVLSTDYRRLDWLLSSRLPLRAMIWINTNWTNGKHTCTFLGRRNAERIVNAFLQSITGVTYDQVVIAVVFNAKLWSDCTGGRSSRQYG